MIKRLDNKKLLRSAARYLERTVDELEGSHFSPGSNRVEPTEVRREIAKVRRWVERLKVMGRENV